MASDGVRVSVLGPIAAVRDGHPIQLGGRMQRALLAALIARHPVQVSTSRISDDLWGDEQPPSAQGTIYAYVSRLRKALGPDVIVKDGDGYRLNLPGSALDATEFTEKIDDAAATSAESPESAAIAYREALLLWRGEPYGELGHELFLLAERARLVELKATAIEGDISARVRTDSSDPSLIVDIESALDEYPLRENLWHALMLATYRQGRQADALRSYQRAARVLGDELGVEPGPELRVLEEQILRQHPGLGERIQDERRRATSTSPSNLRATATSLVGREGLVDRVAEELRQQRIVTLLGPGGVGKTRLAVETAARLMAGYPGGVWDIDLLIEVDPSVVVARLGEALGLRNPTRSDILGRIARHLEDRPTLILLDNCEHLSDGLGERIDELVATCPCVTILATSQVGTGAGAEHIVAVPPLGCAAVDALADEVMREPASQLFEERVRLVKPGYRAFGADAAAIARIVGRLDGLPLAIEIAASQAALRPITEIADQIDDGAAVTLVGASEDPRHGTLEVLVDWGVSQLTPVLRDHLAAACVFAGPFTAASAAVVWGVADEDAEDDLDLLRARSLLEEIPPVEGSPSRYRALESVRQHGRRRLDATNRRTEVSRRHADWLAGLVARAASHYHDGQQASWFARLRLERAEIEPALRALEHDRERWRQLVTNLWYWYYVDGKFDEAARLLQRAVDDEPTAVLIGAQAAVLSTQEAVAREAVAALASRAAELASQLGPDSAVDAALTTLLAGDALTVVGFYERAEPLLLDAARRFRELDIHWGVGWATLRRLDVESLGRGRPDVAEVVHVEAIAHLEAAGDSSRLAYSGIWLAFRERLRGRYQSSLDHGLRALKALEQLGGGAVAAEAMHWVVNALIQLDRCDEAHEALPELRVLAETSGGWWDVEGVDMLEALIAKRTGDVAEAIEIYELLIAETDGYMVARCMLELADAHLRSGDVPAADDTVRRGLPMWDQFENAWYPARFLVIAGEVAVAAGRIEEARQRLGEAVERNLRIRQYQWLARGHEGLADVERRSGDADAAVAHLARASTIRDAIGSHPDSMRRAMIHELSDHLREVLGSVAFERGWSAATEQALDVVQPALQIT